MVGSCSNIVIEMSVLDMWSVLCVPYMGGGVYYSDRTVRNGHVVSDVCFVNGCWDLI